MSKKYIKVVGAVIVNYNDEILCAQRPPGKNLPLMWEFPGGKVEKEETHEEALVRELKEEMDCDIKIDQFITTTVYEYDFGIVELSTYYATVTKGEVKRLEHHDMKWLKRDELNTLDWAPADIPAIEKIMGNV